LKMHRSSRFPYDDPVVWGRILFPIIFAIASHLPFSYDFPPSPEYLLAAYLGAAVFVEYPIIKEKAFKLHFSYRLTLYTILVASGFINSLTYRYLGMAGVPMFLGIALITLLFGMNIGIFAGLFLGLLTSFITGASFNNFIWFMTVILMSAYLLRNTYSRSTVAKVALYVSLVNLGMYLFITYRLLLPFSLQELFMSFVNPFVCSIVVVGLLPYVEVVSRIYSNIGLMELGNLSHPLLKLLSLKAPGTYYHSVVLANLSEAAAEKIGANPVLARICAYYHDIGKVKRPAYFTENQMGENPHEKISPWVSNLILNEHVKYGLELARKHRLPLVIEDIILQHHGTRPKMYFLHKAREKDPEVDESEFAYPGVKPQFKEAGIIMLADSVEAAIKSLRNPKPAKVKEVIREIVSSIYNEGQLNESGLTLKDLEMIVEAFTVAITSMMHERVEYPKDLNGLREKVVNIPEGQRDTTRSEEGR